MLSPFTSAFGGASSDTPSEPAAGPAAGAENRELREMIQNLERQIAGLKKGRTEKPAKARAPRRRKRA
jgi:hypothetical protein